MVFLDNRFVPGSSTPISERDADGNSYQTRFLADGSAHRVLKNFPSREEIGAAVAPWASAGVRHHEWAYYWAVEYVHAATAAPGTGPRIDGEVK